MNTTQNSAVVTGVSTGIGRAIAGTLTKAGWRVFGSVRKEKDASDAQGALGANFTPLIFDVADDGAIRRAATQVESALGGQTLGALVNNAGIAVAAPVAHLDLDDLKRQMDVNVYGPIRVTQVFLPLLGADHSRTGAPGRIVNISSVAGKTASPYMSPYAMSKHALEAMSESLRRELMRHGIDVVVVGPGAIRTPIWAKSDELDVERYRNTEYYDDLVGMRGLMKSFGDAGLDADDVGALVLDILTAARPKTRYAILRNKFSMWTLPRLLPKRLVDRLIAKRLGMKMRDA